MNQIDEEEKKKLVEKKKGVALKTSSWSEELFEDSYEDEDAEMAMLQEDTKSLLSNVINEWEEKALEEIGLGMSHQETIK